MSDENAELPEGWVEVSLSEVIQPVETGKRPKGGVQHITTGVPSIGGEHLNDEGGFKFETLKFVPHEFAESVRNGWIKREDILIVKDGATTGKTSFVDSQFPFERALINEHVVICRPFDGVSPQLLFHYLTSERGNKEILKDFRGAAQGGISKSFAEKVDLPVMPQAEQRRIVGKIEALQERSRNAREALAEVGPLVEQFRQSLLAAAFRGDLTADWRAANPNVEPATKLLNRIRQERRQKWEQAELSKYEAKGKQPPKGWQDKYKEPTVTFNEDVASVEFGISEDNAWEVVPLELLVDPERSIPYGIVKTGDPYPGGIPTVRGGDIKRFSIAFERLKQVNPAVHEQYQRTWLRGGEVLIAIRGTVGETAVVSNEMKGMNISREVALIPVLPGADSRFLMYLLASPAAQRLITGQVKGVAQSGINLADLRLLPTPLPSLDEQMEIANRIEQGMLSIEELSRSVGESQSSLFQLDQSILAKAFRGELVPQDPHDEPASVLLERIREAREAQQKKKSTTKRTKKRPAMRQNVGEKLKEWVSKADEKPFTFDDLRRDISGDYDELKDAVYALLDQKTEVEQVFDESSKAMSFRRLAK